MIILRASYLLDRFPAQISTRLNPEHGTGTLGGIANVECYREAGFLFAGPRSDLILADLEGKWRELYCEKITLNRYTFFVTSATTKETYQDKVLLTNPTIVLNEEGQPTPGPIEICDTFFIQDTGFNVTRLPTGVTKVVFDLVDKDQEVSDENAAKKNHIATPNICVSRINAQSIAIQPPSMALDSNGRPQVVTTSFSEEAWSRDPTFERTMLIDYFNRNHSFRTRRYTNHSFSIGILTSMGFGTYEADEGLDGLSAPRESPVNNANLLDFIRWLKCPALFRVIVSHANWEATYLLDEDDATAALAAKEAGGYPWQWIQEGNYFKPSFKGQSTADLHLFRTLWENKQLIDVPPSLMFHTGCDVNSPNPNGEYGTFQNAESLLFFANQLAILCQIGEWNHGPRGFGNGFGSSGTATFGDGWKGFFERWSNDASLANVEWDRKRCYYWSIVGDWTLQKYYEKLETPQLRQPLDGTRISDVPRNVNLLWDGVLNANLYEYSVEYFDPQTSAWQIEASGSLDASQLAQLTPKGGLTVTVTHAAKMQWFVMAADKNNVFLPSDESLPWTFDCTPRALLPTPVLGPPNAGASLYGMTYFAWGQVTGAATYFVEVEIDYGSIIGAPSYRIVAQSPPHFAGLSGPLQLPEGSGEPFALAGRWRVTANSSDGAAQSTSDWREFSLAASTPILDSPPAGATLEGQTTFSWTPVQVADSYLVEVEVDYGSLAGLPSYQNVLRFIAKQVQADEVQQADLTLPPGMAIPLDGRWRVTAGSGSPPLVTDWRAFTLASGS